MNQEFSKLEQLKKEHDALFHEGQCLWASIELISTRIFSLREKIETMEGGDYDPIQMLFRGTFGKADE